ncbi:hypothetical protein GL50803_00102728 [Giardia duodenalis]|uniref:Uncharacterized protein n=1 Tax=Giardia intestinalis (strain ATCC 50803 / WB clone C6) TaxID=184922 RepID=A8B397_GIAIC|nr:hypothetical protein GL50803_00102728 [Giardia intestinalis]KAE8303128.1 hypothetical protein GL50803_00102728 [Giardia intestinalis]|eukprot:XP_001710160.1 Hypothetical protein GL50803_102728 [Giardia lamblia ATCC 50803]
MLITDSRKACFAVYQQNGMLRLWDATSGMWLRDITDSQLVTMSVTAMLFDTSLALHGKDRAEGQRSEVQGAIIGTNSGSIYTWTSEGSLFVSANYSHRSAVAAIVAPRGASYVLSIDIDGVLIKGIWGQSGSLVKQKEVNILSIPYRHSSPLNKAQPDSLTPATQPTVSEIHMGLLEQSCVIAYGPGLYILDCNQTGINFLGLQSSVVALACEHCLIGVSMRNASIISLLGYYKQEHLLRVGRLVSSDTQTQLTLSASYGKAKHACVTYAITACSSNSVSLFILPFPSLEQVTKKGARIPSVPPALELRASGTLASSILAAIPQYLRAKSAIYIIKGNYTLPSLITEDVPNNLLKDYFFVEDHQTDPDEAKQKTEKRTIADVSARLLQSSHQAIQGAATGANAEIFNQFTRFNEANPNIQSAVLPKAAIAAPPVHIDEFRETSQSDDVLPIEQVIAQKNKHRLHALLTTTSKQARINTAKMLSEEGVHSVFASLLQYANCVENTEYVSDILIWVNTLLKERPEVLKSDRSIPAISGFKSLFHNRISYKNTLVSLSQKLAPLRFSDDILNDLRRQVEEEAQEQDRQALGTDGEDEIIHTDESAEESTDESSTEEYTEKSDDM